MKTFIVGMLVALSGCATTDFAPERVLRPAADAPDHFRVGSPSDPTTTEPTPGDDCRSPMVDPRDGARIQLERSASGLGDYAVAAGRYGVGGDELLRLECGTGRPVGVVPR